MDPPLVTTRRTRWHGRPQLHATFQRITFKNLNRMGQNYKLRRAAVLSHVASPLRASTSFPLYNVTWEHCQRCFELSHRRCRMSYMFVFSTKIYFIGSLHLTHCKEIIATAGSQKNFLWLLLRMYSTRQKLLGRRNHVSCWALVSVEMAVAQGLLKPAVHTAESR